MFNVRMYLDYIINYILMSFLQRKGKDILLLLSPSVLLHCCGHSSMVTSDQTPTMQSSKQNCFNMAQFTKPKVKIFGEWTKCSRQ